MCKHLFYLLFLSAVLFGCEKEETELKSFEHNVLCDLPLNALGSRQLLITDALGNVLDSIKLSGNVQRIEQKVSYKAETASEKFGLHLFLFNKDFPGSVSIYSKIGIQSGKSVSFDKVYNYNVPGTDPLKNKVLIINNIQKVDAIRKIPSNTAIDPFVQQYANKASLTLAMNNANWLLLSMRANGQTTPRALALQSGQFKNDTFVVDWAQFETETAQEEVQIPGGQTLSNLTVWAVSPDFKNRIMLHGENNGNNQTPSRFFKPKAIPADWSTIVYVGANTGYVGEKIFAPGQALKFDPPAFSPQSAAATPWNKITVQCNGTADILQGYTNQFQSSRFMEWSIDLHPAATTEIIIPKLQKFMPTWVNQADVFRKGSIRMQNYIGEDAEKVWEGFPEKLQTPFARARSGYESLEKTY
jgi:hypothetical protein